MVYPEITLSWLTPSSREEQEMKQNPLQEIDNKSDTVSTTSSTEHEDTIEEIPQHEEPSPPVVKRPLVQQPQAPIQQAKEQNKQPMKQSRSMPVFTSGLTPIGEKQSVTSFFRSWFG